MTGKVAPDIRLKMWRPFFAATRIQTSRSDDIPSDRLRHPQL